MKVIRFVLIFVIVSSGYAFLLRNNYVLGDASEHSEFTAKKYKVEDISAQVLADGAMIYVSWKVRNLHHNPIKGDVAVYLVDGGENIASSVEAEVNDKRPIPPGGIGFFEVYSNVEGFKLEIVQVIYVDFIER